MDYATINDDGDFEGIHKSKYFLAIIDEDYVHDAASYIRLRYAIEEKKPMIVLIQDGTHIPENFFAGAEIEYKQYWKDPADMFQKLDGIVTTICNKIEADNPLWRRS